LARSIWTWKLGFGDGMGWVDVVVEWK
jgi:hypothetical protein